MQRKHKKKSGKYIDPDSFYLARRRAGLSREQAADMLDVTPKTVRNWEGAMSPIPYTAFKVMRAYGGYLLTGEKWEDWTITPTHLFSPEGRSFEPHELRHISNYFTMARLFLKQTQTQTQPQNLKTIETPPALNEASRAVPPTTTLRVEAGTPTAFDAEMLRDIHDSVQRLLGLQEKTKGGETLRDSFKFRHFENYLPTANDDCYAAAQ